ncbi:MAG: DNA-directed RNA polymerase subunit beta [Planctomycetia bacterium]|nr:DNA-directed RNA polymerase subunit beta [Planctomycetia bacterium]MBL6915042.1 DNA-directed RNA polymerase subunit beta [Planctomycetota bacterium]
MSSDFSASVERGKRPVKVFGSGLRAVQIPNLMELQINAYSQFLQRDVHWADRDNIGLESILREIFPIESYDGSINLTYLGYDLGSPRYTVDECRQLKLTYGAPFKIRLQLVKEGGETLEEEVYLGEIPLMIGGGEFIVNGSERVIVSQLHRSPGVDFSAEIHTGDVKLHSCRIIPERGSWVEFNVTKKGALSVRIDQSGKFPASMLLRAMEEEFGTSTALLSQFYDLETVKAKSVKDVDKLIGQEVEGVRTGRVSAEDVLDAETGEVLLHTGDVFTETFLNSFFSEDMSAKRGGKSSFKVLPEEFDDLFLKTIREDNSIDHEDALIKIYTRLRPGNPPQVAKARELFFDKFKNDAKYRLGKVGRFRINRKFGLDIQESLQTIQKEDILESISYIFKLRDRKGQLDDIDHLGNRRVRTVEELAGDELRKGFLKLKRTVQERMSMMEPENLTPRSVINSKTISSAVEFFFGRGELSQVVDQTNPLSQLTHERRLSALGPGGLNRKRAGFEVRDVHISHYGRICPIETPEGTNIGLISSLSVFATIDKYGFLITPYFQVNNGKVNLEKDSIQFLRADEEENKYLTPADSPVGQDGELIGDLVLARYNGEFIMVDPDKIELMDVSSKQLIGVSAALIPFLEHDDANRALMGSNMMRQAVPLLITDPPLVGTGMEEHVSKYSGMVLRSPAAGTVTSVDAGHVEIDGERIELRKYRGLNERTCQNQRPCVVLEQQVEKGDVIADGAATENGVLSLGRNVLVAFMSWDGYNFEDAIIVSEELVREDVYTSIHIDEFEIEVRETKLGREEFTRDIPNVSERVLFKLDEQGIIKTGTQVVQGDILVGKVVPKSKSELSPEEKLLHAIFGRAGEDVKNESLTVGSGIKGVVIGSKKFSRKNEITPEERKSMRTKMEELESTSQEKILFELETLLSEIKEVTGSSPRSENGQVFKAEELFMTRSVHAAKMALKLDLFLGSSEKNNQLIKNSLFKRFQTMEEVEDSRNREVNRLTRGDELAPGVIEMVKVWVATKRNLSVGDKMAGRHGNKGVISRILPLQDLPFLEDGQMVEVILNPLGVPSRMNLGQILETQLGWAADKLGYRAVTPVFDGATEAEIRAELTSAGLTDDGKSVLYDGRTGERFEQKVTVGRMYLLKLHHLVDDKIHARATGPYSLITQQPLGGKARFGGQRFGEMEVWALEAYGAAHILQELLTAKSDDVDGRAKIYESMVKGENSLQAGTPVSFDVLTNEIKGLGLNLELEKK